MAPQIDIAIDALVLHELGVFDPDSFGAALSSELTRLMGDVPPDVGQQRVEVMQIVAPAAADSAALGLQVARAVFSQMCGGAP